MSSLLAAACLSSLPLLALSQTDGTNTSSGLSDETTVIVIVIVIIVVLLLLCVCAVAYFFLFDEDDYDPYAPRNRLRTYGIPAKNREIAVRHARARGIVKESDMAPRRAPTYRQPDYYYYDDYYMDEAAPRRGGGGGRRGGGGGGGARAAEPSLNLDEIDPADFSESSSGDEPVKSKVPNKAAEKNREKIKKALAAGLPEDDSE